MIRWIKAYLRTRKALKALKREIDVQRIELGVDECYGITRLSQDLRCTGGSIKLQQLCREYLIVKRIGADAAVLHKLGGDA